MSDGPRCRARCRDALTCSYFILRGHLLNVLGRLLTASFHPLQRAAHPLQRGLQRARRNNFSGGPKNIFLLKRDEPLSFKDKKRL